MTVNSLFPGFVRMLYTGNAHPHIQVLPVKSITPNGASWDLGTKSGGVLDWASAVLAYATVFVPFLASTDEVISASLWQIASVGADPIFLAEDDISLAGTNAGAAVPMGQAVMTFRTSLGGLYRWYCMEPAIADDTILFPPYTGPFLALFNYLTGVNSVVVGRDGGSPTSSIRLVSKENDALRKKYLLNV